MIQSSFYLCENSHYGKKLDISYHKFNDLKKTQSSIKKNILKYFKISKYLYMVQIGSQKYVKMFECLNWIYGWSPPQLHHQGKENKTQMVDTNLFKSTSRQIEWCLLLQWIFPVVSEYIYIQIKLSLIGWSKWLAHVENFNWSSLYTIERFHVYGREWRNTNTCEMGERKEQKERTQVQARRAKPRVVTKGSQRNWKQIISQGT